jgi:hypothetical protein
MTHIYTANTNRFRRKPPTGWDRAQKAGFDEHFFLSHLKMEFGGAGSTSPQISKGSIIKVQVINEPIQGMMEVWVLVLEWLDVLKMQTNDATHYIDMEVQCFNQKHEAEHTRMLKQLPDPGHIFVRKIDAKKHQ